MARLHLPTTRERLPVLIRQTVLIPRITRAGCELRRCDGRLPSSKRAVSILQLWCSLNLCTSIVDLHRANFWDHGGQHGQESEEGKGKEDSQEEKEVAVQRNLLLSG